MNEEQRREAFKLALAALADKYGFWLEGDVNQDTDRAWLRLNDKNTTSRAQAEIVHQMFLAEVW